MEFPKDLRYSPDHEWVRVDGGNAVVGITDFAQDSLGDVVYVDLPEVGAAVERAGRVCEVESTKSVSEVYAPVAGTVRAVNERLGEEPELVNRDPYGEGWIFAVELADAAAVDALLDAEAYRALVEEG